MAPGKTHVTIAFQARPGCKVAKVFGIRVVTSTEEAASIEQDLA